VHGVTPEQIIGYYVQRLREGGAHNVDEYEARLRNQIDRRRFLHSFLGTIYVI
jgi:hypothetical protein